MKPFTNPFKWLVVSIALVTAHTGLCAVPVINGFSPTVAAPGASVTISGANFGATLTNDIVYFGPVHASITSATPTNIVVTVPNGAMYAPITVTVGGLVAYSIKPFEPTFSGNGAAFDATSFAPRLDIPLPSGPTRVAVADLNGDGKPDLIVGSIYAHLITILQNNSTSGSLDTNSFTVVATIPFANSAQSPYWLTAGDVDGDGKIDFIAPDEAANRILIYRNISSGGTLTANSFADPVAFDVGTSPRNVALRDLDGDGRPDLVVANVDGQSISILKNIGTAGVINTNSFAPQFQLQAGSQPHDVTIGDIDGDGKPDIAVNNYTSPFVSLYRNVSATGVLDTNSFAAPFALPAPMSCNSVILGDVDNDGKLDLLIGTAQGNNELSVYRNTATPGPFSTNSFAARLDFPGVGWVNTVAVGDLNGDGKLDVGMVNQMNSTFALFQNVGTSNFNSASLASRVDFVSGNDPIGLTIVDLDGDGRPDVIFNNTYDLSVSIYRNINGTPVAPYITSQPANRTVAAGSTATFSVTAVGTAPLNYQWWKSTGKILNATNSSLTLTNVQTTNAGTYFVVVTNLYGSVTSSNAVLTVNSNTNNGAPFIIRQPANQTVHAGGIASFAVLAIGSAPFSYQWFGPAGVISNATGSILILSNVQPANAGNYHVLVSNVAGSTISTNAVLTVLGVTNPPPACVPPPSGIAAWWPAEGNGNDVVNGNNAILEDGVSFGAGEVGQAFLLQNPTNAFMHVPASSNLNVGAGSGLTMEGWIKVSSVSGLHPIAEWDGNDRDHVGVQMWLNSNPFQSGALFGNLVDTNDGQHVLVSADGIVVPNVFQHVALTYDRTSGIGTLYLNGAVVAQANLGSFVPQTTYDLWIAHRPSSVEGDSTYQTFLGGALDELSLYRRALSSNEIASIYSAGTNGKCREVTGTAPVITKQPTNQTVAVGGIATFSVTATGSSPLHYQWSGPAGTISNATSSVLTVTNVQLANAGNYHVLVSNAFGSTTSSNALLTVTGGTNTNFPPTITKQPTNQTVAAGGIATFTVTATGSPALHYQWHGPENFFSSSTSSTLVLSNVQPSQAGNYFVIVTNQFGSATSSNAVLTVLAVTNPPPACVPPPSGIAAWWPAEGNGNDVVNGNNAILEDGVSFGAGGVGQAFLLQNPTNAFMHVPASSNLNVGASSGLTMEGWIKVSSVSGLHPIAEWDGDDRFHVGVQMWLNSNPFQSGALFGNLVDTNDGQHVLVSADGIVVPNMFQHVALTYDQGSGVGTLYLNGAVVAQANLGSFVPQTTYDLWIGHRPSSVEGDSTYQTFLGGALDELSLYRRALSSNEIASIYSAGTNGKCREVTGTAPVITKQPTNQTVTAGGTATFSVTATGTAPLHYQWSGPVGVISNATSSTLVLSNVQPANAGNYHVLVSNAFGSVNSSNATLTVNPGIATIRVINTSAPGGTSVTVPITLSAVGNENALSFSLNFDPARLTYSSVSLGSDATDALLVPNASQAGSGRIGIALALPSGETFAAGTQEVVRVTFNTSIISNTQAVTAVSFGNQPIAKLLSDAFGQPLAVEFANGSVTLTVSSFEGDAAPVPMGNGSVNLFDLVQVGRFVAGLDIITNGSEFQKVDCAPRDTLGDGKLRVNDWVQAARYAAGLDPLTAAGGPTAPVSPVSAHAQSGLPISRQVVIGSGATVKGMGLTLPVNLNAQGDETALAFSLNFDPTVLRYVGAAKGSDASAAALTVNANQAASGQLAIVLTLPNDGSHFAAGTKELAKVSFVALASATNNSVGFADQPVPRSISDANAVELDANYLSSSIVINPQPAMNLSISSGSSVLSWPTWAGDFTLQAASSLTPPITWTNVPVTLQTNGDHIEVTLPASGQQTFFRLYHP